MSQNKDKSMVLRLPAWTPDRFALAFWIALCLWQLQPNAAAAAQWASVSEPGSLSGAANNETRPVLACYYAWWEPDMIAGAVDTPTQLYSAGIRQLADDPQLLRDHIRLAQAAGIDGFIVNRAPDLATLLDVVGDTDFRVTLQVDATLDARSQLRDFYRHADHLNLVRYQGRPVVFF